MTRRARLCLAGGARHHTNRCKLGAVWNYRPGAVQTYDAGGEMSADLTAVYPAATVVNERPSSTCR